MPNHLRIVRMPEVLERKGDSKPSLYKYTDEGVWLEPAQLRSNSRYVGWLSTEVDTLIEAWALGMDDDNLRKLVNKLREERKARLERMIAELES